MDIDGVRLQSNPSELVSLVSTQFNKNENHGVIIFLSAFCSMRLTKRWGDKKMKARDLSLYFVRFSDLRRDH